MLYRLKTPQVSVYIAVLTHSRVVFCPIQQIQKAFIFVQIALETISLYTKHGGGFPFSCILKVMTSYRIAGNFRGRKPSRISRFCGCSRKFSLQNLGVWQLLARHKQAISESFLHENHIFTNSRKFSPSKVSHYTV